MAQSERPDDLASICSSLSSDEGVRTGSSEHLVDLLTRPRARGGYGGRLNYTEFSTLATSLGWTGEDMDDCWYDIMMGEPSAEAANVARVAECICSYCLAAPLPLLENYKLQEDDDDDATTPSVVEATSPAAPPAPAATPPRPPTPPAAHSSTCVVLSPPSPKAPQSPHATRSNTKRRVHLPAGTLPRYAVETVSSERRRLSAAAAAATHASSPTPSRGRTRSKSPARITATAAAAASPTEANTVFFRLYENGMEQHRKRSSAKPLPDATAEAECTFAPRIAPYVMKDNGDGTARTTHFNKPTKSYFAKLTEEAERSTDALAHAPETPRVNYHPAPGPSSTVPRGYVEGVARLRRYVASRYDSADAHRSLRDAPRRDVHRLVDAPILRLPVTVEGVSDTVDVRLATVHQPPPSSSPRLQQDLPPPSQRYRDAYNGDVADTYTAASTPRRSPSAVVRYKEHLRFY